MKCETKAENYSDHPIKSVQTLKEMYPGRFTGIGKFTKTERLTLMDNASPVMHPPRRAPVQLQEKIKTEMQRMQNMEVIRPVEEPTDWVCTSPIVHYEYASIPNI